MEYIGECVCVKGPKNEFVFQVVRIDEETFVMIDKKGPRSFNARLLVPLNFWGTFVGYIKNSSFMLVGDKCVLKSSPVKYNNKHIYFFDIVGKTSTKNSHIIIKESIYQKQGNFLSRTLYIFDDELLAFTNGLMDISGYIRNILKSSLCPMCKTEMFERNKPISVIVSDLCKRAVECTHSIVKYKYFCPNCKLDYENCL